MKTKHYLILDEENDESPNIGVITNISQSSESNLDFNNRLKNAIEEALDTDIEDTKFDVMNQLGFVDQTIWVKALDKEGNKDGRYCFRIIETWFY